MNKLTFDDVMSFYPKHNRAIYDQILLAQRSSCLVPFVGAGLSAFCGYKLWGAVLSELAEFIPTEDDQQTALKQISSFEYEKAAQTILDAYPLMLDQLPTIVSPEKIHSCPQDTFRSSAAYALPYLFPKGLVITTNFDRVLETIYLDRLNKPLQVVTPKEQDRLAQLRQNQALGLFKLHGDIGNDTVSVDDLVFTGEQYQCKYRDNSPLVQELTRWFENRRLLFLGCSLNVDRTMEILKQVAMSQSGIRHYAILGCQKSDIPNRLKELSSLGILPIFYDSQNHDAIRVVLERLLEDTNSVSYAALKKASWISPISTKEERRLLFDSDYFAFAGREQELQQLDNFCSEVEQTLWWAVTGPGGMGKSRLVYEFAKRKQQEGWKIARFETRPSKSSIAKGLDELEAWTPETDKTLIILDDVQAYMDSVFRWLSKVERLPRSEKLRIILLEREGKAIDSASWLDIDSQPAYLSEWVYNESFLYLKNMADDEIMTVMNNYATAAGKSLNAELLLKTLEKVDPDLKRPLYAIAIADARCQGKDPTNWDRKEILDTLLKRELKFHFDRLIGISDQKIKLSKTLQSELETLFAHSCVHDLLPIDDIAFEQYKTINNLMLKLNMDPEEFFDRMGVLRKARFYTVVLDKYGNEIEGPSDEKEKKAISLSCPDLIKEHLVLNLAFGKEKMELLFPEDWQGNPMHILFLRKILSDHNDRLKDNPIFLETYLNVLPADGLPAMIYCDILWGIVVILPDYAKSAIDKFSVLYEEYNHDPAIAVFYSNAITSLMREQNPNEFDVALKRMESLYHDYPDNAKISTNYAKCLRNLTAEEDLAVRAAAVEQLDNLYREQPSQLDIAIALAEGTLNIAINQDASSQANAVKQIEAICNSHANDPYLIALLIHAFTLLLYSQEPNDRPTTIEKLEKCYSQNSEHEAVQKSFAGALVTIALVQQSEADVRKTLSRSKELSEKYPDDTHIQLTYAETWFNLTLVQKEKDIPGTVACIHNFLETHPSVVPEFKEALDEYLSKHPEHTERYTSFQNL